jgi:hypothetical protein
MLDDATLAEYLDRLGWERVPHGAGTLRAVRDTEQGDVAVYVRLSQNWLIASVVPFLVTGGDNPHDLARWLLRMNRDGLVAHAVLHRATLRGASDGATTSSS